MSAEPLTVLVTGADEVWGHLTAEAVLAAPGLRDGAGTLRPVGSVVLVLHDEPWLPERVDDPRVRCVRGDIVDDAQISAIVAEHRPSSVFHFETVTRDRGAGDDDFGVTLRTNLLGSIHLLEALRRLELPVAPKLVFCSSVAVFTDALAEPVNEATRRLPSSTYGATKAAVELLIGAYGDRGYVDARAALLPMNVSWRPDRRSRQFLHDAFEEPFDGGEIPVTLLPDTVLHLNGHRTSVANLLELHDLDGAALGADRTLLQTAIAPTVRDIVDAITRAAAARGIALGPVVERPDPVHQARMDRYVKNVDDRRARALGLSSEDLDALVEAYLDDLLALDQEPATAIAQESA